ncbi:helix-turn-helix domain-containing protein [Nicoliella lavandulae]|uniref:Helix-turn-helix transcriptional regulator n=1 Tax=Nicoliella lavandulae TaxID=3082954 RepID=A0ABU8SKI0_9LACO
MMLKNFGKRLRTLRRGRHLTQAKLAAALNEQFGTHPRANSVAQLGKWELGLRSPSIPELIKLATFFNVSIDFLVDRTENDANVVELSTILVSTNELKFNNQPLTQDDKSQIFELITAFMKGKAGRKPSEQPKSMQEELSLDLDSKD